MDGMYGMRSTTTADYSDKTLMLPENLILPSDYQTFLSSPPSEEEASAFQNHHHHHHRVPLFISDELLSAAASAISSEAEIQIPRGEEDMFNLIKSKIASHPSYPRLLQAYIDCQKVVAPPEIACLLDEIRRENDLCKGGDSTLSCLGVDPDLDDFMETYCCVLMKYKSDLERPFDEASTFLNKIETQLRNLCTGASTRTLSDEGGAASSEEELSGGETEVQEVQPSSEDRDLKHRLMRKFGSHISTLKLEFSKKKKKGKLPKEARQTLLQWWNVHYKWPYPTEADKISLAETTGLDQKQINNWFINQRKRHWKPSESMQFPVMDHNISGVQFYPDD